jgi:hypothetical protein
VSDLEYIRCPKCEKSNPVDEINYSRQYNCIFRGIPFTLPKETETRQVTGEEAEDENRIPEAPPVREPINRNLTKPLDREKDGVLR